MEKDEIRKIMLNKRKRINDKGKLSTNIGDKIKNLDIYQKAHVIAFYKSLIDEVNTDYLINYTLLEKIVLLPKIVDNKIEFIRITNDTKYVKSKIGVMEPIGDVYTGNIDLIIVPGLAFDKKLNRLGFGMGYYDRYLNDKNIFKIGVCFDSQLVNLLPVNELDIKMDLVITDKRLIKKV